MPHENQGEIGITQQKIEKEVVIEVREETPETITHNTIKDTTTSIPQEETFTEVVIQTGEEVLEVKDHTQEETSEAILEETTEATQEAILEETFRDTGILTTEAQVETGVSTLIKVEADQEAHTAEIVVLTRVGHTVGTPALLHNAQKTGNSARNSTLQHTNTITGCHQQNI